LTNRVDGSVGYLLGDLLSGGSLELAGGQVAQRGLSVLPDDMLRIHDFLDELGIDDPKDSIDNYLAEGWDRR